MTPEFWRGKKVFLTGHTGFKGGWLALWLARHGADLCGYALAPPTRPSLFDVARVGAGVTSVIGDVRDAEGLGRAVASHRSEIVVHMAAQPLVRESYADPVLTYATNVMGAVHLLEAARRATCVRVVLVVTSDKCYENREWRWGYREDEAMGGHDPYASSKGCAELVAAAYRRSFLSPEGRIALATARAGNVIGGGDWARDRLVPDAMRAIDAGATLMVRNPAAVRPWQHVLDPLHGYLTLAERLWNDPASFAEAWNFGPDEGCMASVADLVAGLAERQGGAFAWRVADSGSVHEAGILRLDSGKARTRLGWRPRLALDRALDWTAAWYQAFRRDQDMHAFTLDQIERYEALEEEAAAVTRHPAPANPVTMAVARTDDGIAGARACRFCAGALTQSVVDLGMSPLSNAFLSADRLGCMEPFYPLHAYVCGGCFLVQLESFASPERIFGDYVYFSSFSETWLGHARAYTDRTIQRFGLDRAAHVIEIASNDGYLLRNFLERGFRVLGVEPAANVAEAARRLGIRTEVAFFGATLARDLRARGDAADLLIANNVLAHVPDLNDFVAGMAILLAPDGIATIEFPHLLHLLAETQFDTIYHEHFSYFSLMTAVRVLGHHGLAVFDVETLPTHGGSLRVYAAHPSRAAPLTSDRVAALIASERSAGLDRLETYAAFESRVRKAKRDLLSFLVGAREAGGHIVGYGAAAKGNTLLNSCGVGRDLIDYVVDRSPHKQGRFLPGSHIPVCAPARLSETKPDFVLILPWNLTDEIVAQASFVRDWGGRFVVPIPSTRVLP